MGIESRLENLFNLRKEQVEKSDKGGPEAEKRIEEINQQVEKLTSSGTKIGQTRMGELQGEAEKEDEFRDEIKRLSAGFHLKINPREFSEQMEGDKRYVAMQVESNAGGKKISGFFKALKPNFRKDEYSRDRNAFVREMRTMTFLKQRIELPVLEIYSNNTDQEKTLYNLTETLPEAEIGFIHSREDIKKLTTEHARQAVDQLFRLNEVKLPDDVDRQIPDLQDPFEHFEGYKENLWNLLDNKEEPDCTAVRPLDGEKDQEGKIKPEIYLNVLARRFGLDGKDLRKKVEQLLERWQDAVTKYDNGDWTMTHGDLSPSNMYVGDDNKAQFLDWEWAGKTRNKLMAMVYDYGNMRARAWSNPEFQNALDREIKRRFAEQGDMEAGRAVVSLGTLRSHAMLTGFFENYEPDKQLEPEEEERRKLTEAALAQAFAEAGIEFGKFKG